ncbi:MAG: histidine--tRNA ligase [Acidobacteriota bacterium]|nr:histidine--tRNA ligase [Acidobacteriota bacterium]
MNTHPARGMRDFLPEDVRRRQYVIGVIADVYQRYGFEPLETPAVENIETLLGKYGEEGDKLIFKILKRGEGAEAGEADLALRYDLTVPLARVVAEHRARLPKFFKRYQVQPVWRADRPQKGRFREFFQCDVDAIGSRSMLIEAELLGAAGDVLARLGFADYTLRLNHRGVLAGLLEASGVPEGLQADALTSLDKLDKIGADGVEADLRSRGVPEEGARLLLELFGAVTAARAQATVSPEAVNEDVMARLERLVGHSRPDAVAELRQILTLVAPSAAGRHVRLDPSLARGLSYYTGAIFEIAVPDLAGSLGGGGRYDHLIGMFLGEEVAACGISLGLERILVVMAERHMFPENLGRAAADVMVTVWHPDVVADALRLAAELRSAGLRVEVYPEADKIGRQFKYAASRAIPFVTVVGEDESAKGVVTVKTLDTGEQRIVPRADVASAIVTGRST